MSLSLDGTTGISASGNITGGNVIASGSLVVGTFAPASVSTAGNVTGAYIIGNGSALTGLPAGYSNSNLATLGSNVISTTGTITGGNITGGNILTGGLISSTGNITGGNISATNHTGTTVSVTGAVTGASVVGGVMTGTSVSVTGAVSGASASVSGTVTGASVVGGVITGSSISVSGNVTGAYLFGNASTVTGLSASKIFNGTSEANIGTSGGNANITIAGTSNVFVVASTGIYTTGLSSVTGNITGGNLLTGGLISATGSLTTGGDHSLVGNIVDTGALWINTSSNGNITLNPNGTGQVNIPVVLSVTGNITGGNISATNHTGTAVSVTGAVTAASVVGGVITGSSTSVTGTTTAASVVGGVMSGSSLTVTTGTITGGNIVNGNGNGVGNIGSSTTYFNTVFAKATSAQYADLAEMYCADSEYTPGTVLDFGGTEEVTITTKSHSTQVAGIVSTNPSYLMNSTLTCTNALEVALVGRVPCHVVGTIAKGDRLVASSTPGIATRLDMSQYQPGCIIGKALEDYDSETVGTIEVAVGRI
jgi:hypothetical protein